MAIQVETEKFTEDDEGKGRYVIRWKADSREEAESGIDRTYRGLVLKGKSSGQWFPGSAQYLVDATYEGLIGDATPEEQEQFDLTFETVFVKIEQFPDRDGLVEEFGAYLEDGRLKFTELLPQKSARSGKYKALGRSKTEIANPLLNVTEYPVSYAVGLHSFLKRTASSSIDGKNNMVVNKLPSGFEYTASGSSISQSSRNPGATVGTLWRVLVSRSKEGNAWRYRLEYRELDPAPHYVALNELIEKSRGGGRRA